MADQARADELFRLVLGGTPADPGPPGAHSKELTWPNGARLRLTERPGDNGLTRLLFSRTAAYTAREREQSASLAADLGVPLSLGG